jgi:hypothetical protein
MTKETLKILDHDLKVEMSLDGYKLHCIGNALKKHKKMVLHVWLEKVVCFQHIRLHPHLFIIQFEGAKWFTWNLNLYLSNE